MDQALRDKMCARMREVQTQVAERDELIEVIAIALLTRKNVFVLGDTGQAKSAVINLFRDGLTGARQFERLMSKQADEEALFGRLDLSSLIPGGVPEEILEEDALYQEMRRDLETLVLNYRRGDASFGQQLELATTELERYRKALSELHGGEPRIITKGKLPDSHIVFLDEIFKASDGILNALLTALNERRYTNEGKTIHIPTISFFSASNEIPNFTNPEEKILKPLYDRFELKVVTEYVEEFLFYKCYKLFHILISFTHCLTGQLLEYIIHRIGMKMRLQPTGGVKCFDTSVHHDRYTVTIFCFIHVMGSHKDRYPPVGSLINQLPELTAGSRIDSSRRFIKKHDPRIVED